MYENKNILLLGDKFVGKTSLFDAYINPKHVGKTTPTMQSDVSRSELESIDENENIEKLTKEMICLQIWETSRHDEFKYRNAHCCIFVYDVTSRKSFENLNSLWDGFFMTNKKNPNEFPVAVVGNKIDLENERKVSKQEAIDWCKSTLSTVYFECSSKDDINVQQMFGAMIGILVDIYNL